MGAFQIVARPYLGGMFADSWRQGRFPAECLPTVGGKEDSRKNVCRQLAAKKILGGMFVEVCICRETLFSPYPRTKQSK